ncbi:mannosyltransferase [Emydomyces testavorans]|uniref:Mannosyltransferase n=1 Tax=Emydomyces testavorans TaxID=2070801 RepID=A0AAF0DHM3_9EURO|nr:mannosyltransferase [Emydomyces testavorans]
MVAAVWLVLWLFILRPSTCDADFMSVRTSMNTDYSGKNGDPAQKYFHEATFHYHYDGRYVENNDEIMPWDSDIDVQVSETTMHFLAKYYNMTEHHFRVPGIPAGRTFLLEINPHFVNRNPEDELNMIDARWIDTSSGLFIDITSVRKDYDARKRGNEGALMSKDKHTYKEQDLFPLRDSFFEGIPVKVPYAYIKLLEEEYGKDCLVKTEFNK